MELDTVVSQPELEQIERLGATDLVVGILDTHQCDGAAAVATVREAVANLPGTTRAVVVCSDGTSSAPPIDAHAAGNGESPPVAFFRLSPPNLTDSSRENLFDAYQAVIAVGGKLGARACVLTSAQPQGTTSDWIYRLARPIIELGFDLVAPLYTRHRLEGLLNRSVLAPLHRALYGAQLQNPMGPDFAISKVLMQQVMAKDSLGRRGEEDHPAASIASTAVCGGFRICQSHLGARTQPPTDWMNLSSLLAQVLGPVFLDMERRAAFWQRIRESVPVPGFGRPEPLTEDTGTVDVRQLIESFQLGTGNLQDVWGLVLPPSTLLELRKLSRLSVEKFRMPDNLWVWIVYDFALGHRLRTISRDHLLRSITPLYLGWIASYALEMEAAKPAEIEARIERLSRAYEARKSYLVSRWRWPDRFNP